MFAHFTRCERICPARLSLSNDWPGSAKKSYRALSLQRPNEVQCFWGVRRSKLKSDQEALLACGRQSRRAQMKKTKRRLFGFISAVIGIALSVAAVEGLAILWLMPRTAAIRRPPSCSSQNTYVRDADAGHATAATSTRSIRIPMSAFVHHANPPCGLPRVNNVGLFGPDFPTVQAADRYIVMLTGGSVASQLAQNSDAARAALSRGGAEQANTSAPTASRGWC